MHGERLPDRRFYKSPTFARQASELDAWAEVDELKKRLARDPLIGDVMQGTGGLRKVRMPLPGRGSRGGGRVIYFQIVEPASILLLALYAKSDMEDLDHEDRASLMRLCAVMCLHLRQLP